MHRTLAITGMTCEHCARTVEVAFNALPGVHAAVSYPARRAQVDLTDDADEAALFGALRAKGYDAHALDADPASAEPPAAVGGDGDGLHIGAALPCYRLYEDDAAGGVRSLSTPGHDGL